MSKKIEAEITRRKEMWDDLLTLGGPEGMTAKSISDIGIYGGGRGMFYDKTVTTKVTEDGKAIIVGLKHTGEHYADDISEDGIIYHYPDTNAEGSDEADIEATKTACRLQIPIFVITGKGNQKNVLQGYVEEWNDKKKLFYVTFGPKPDEVFNPDQKNNEPPFKKKQKKKRTQTKINQRPGQAKFRFDVLNRYQHQCAVCQIKGKALLDAAHIVNDDENGTDDARNGLLLCPTHHRAFDKQMFCFDPETTRINYFETSKNKLKIEYDSLNHLYNSPHFDALNHRWLKWNKYVEKMSN